MRKLVFIPVGIYCLLLVLVSILLKVQESKMMIVLLSGVAMLVTIWVLMKVPDKREDWFSQSIKRFKQFVMLTAWFQIAIVIYLGVRIYQGLDPEILFFYLHVFLLFECIGLLLCLGQMELRKKNQ